MFQVFSRRLLMNSGSAVGAVQFPKFNSTLQNRARPKEIRDVKLIGTIIQNPLTLKDGAKVLTVKTVQPDGYYKIHRALVRSPKILELLGDNLSAGQRVYIAGELQTVNFINEENQQRQSLNVKVNELYASKTSETNDEAHKNIDQNNVCLLSYIATDIGHLDTHSVFSLIGHYTARNEIEGETEKVQFYRIFVHDKDLIEMLKTNIQRKDRVLVNGFLSYKAENDQNGQRKYIGHIEATHILRVDRFSQNFNEQTAEEEFIKTSNE